MRRRSISVKSLKLKSFLEQEFLRRSKVKTWKLERAVEKVTSIVQLVIDFLIGMISVTVNPPGQALEMDATEEHDAEAEVVVISGVVVVACVIAVVGAVVVVAIVVVVAFVVVVAVVVGATVVVVIFIKCTDKKNISDNSGFN